MKNPVSICASCCRDSVFRSTAVQFLQRVRFGSRTDRVCPDVFGQTFRNSGGAAPLPVCLPSGGYAGRSWAGHWLQGIRVQQGAQSVLSSLGRVVSARVSVGTGSRPDHCHEYFGLNTAYALNQVQNCSRSQLATLVGCVQQNAGVWSRQYRAVHEVSGGALGSLVEEKEKYKDMDIMDNSGPSVDDSGSSDIVRSNLSN